MPQFPFSAIVGADDMALALILTTVSPQVGGVLVRGEKGTAKSTMVRALTDVLPEQDVVDDCRFACDPARPDPTCPDGPHDVRSAHRRPARLVELPVGAGEDRVIGSLDLSKALSTGRTTFEPGLLAQANRGLLYVDEVNLLHDHLVDVLLDAAAMGRNTVEREGVSVSHAASITLVGTMNPEEGELRPQLLDRFGLTVEVAASRDPGQRAEVVRRRLAFDADPDGFSRRYDDDQQDLRDRLAAATTQLAVVRLTDRALSTIARVCAGFDVDGMRADIVTARAARAHAAWAGRDEVTKDDIRVAAKLALPHRRRRNPFDAPGLDEDLLEQLLNDEPEDPPPGDEQPEHEDCQNESARDETPGDEQPGEHEPSDSTNSTDRTPHDDGANGDTPPAHGAATTGTAPAGKPYRPRTFRVRGLGHGAAGRRSKAITTGGHTIGATTRGEGTVHLPATVLAAAPHQVDRGRGPADGGLLRIEPADVRRRVTQGRESNLVLIAVDASGSMGARRRMEEVKTAVLSLLMDAYQRRDRVGVVSFRGSDAELILPPTSSVEAAARCLTDLPHGGRTPLAEGLTKAAHTLQLERIRDPRRRPLLVLVTDGRATAGQDALARARSIADRWPGTGVDAVVVDCESGRFRMGLAAQLAQRMGAEHVPVEELAADALIGVVRASNGRAA